MTAIPLTVLPTSGFPSTVKPTTASIKIDWWMFVSFGTSFFGYYCSGFSRCGFATHGFPMCGPSICDSFRSDTTKKQAHMRIAVVPAVHIWALIVDFWLHPHRCFSCHSLCKVVLRSVLHRTLRPICWRIALQRASWQYWRTIRKNRFWYSCNCEKYTSLCRKPRICLPLHGWASMP